MLKLNMNDPDSLDHRNPAFIRTVTTIFQKTIFPYHRAEVRGMERIPAKNGVLYIGNHNGFPYMAEAFIMLSAIFDYHRMSRYPYILMHDLPLKVPISNHFFTNYGCVRATQENATAVLDRGEPLMIFPGGSDELMRPHRDRARLRFDGRMGYIRLALKYNIPIVPFVGVGGHSTSIIVDDMRGLAEAIGAKSRLRLGAWPLMLSIPWGLTLGPFIPPYLPWPAKILMEALEPIVFPGGEARANDKEYVRACAQQVERALEDALARLEAERVSRHGLRRYAQESLASSRQRLAELLQKLGRKMEEVMAGLLPRGAGATDVLPDADRAFAELIKQAAAVATIRPAARTGPAAAPKPQKEPQRSAARRPAGAHAASPASPASPVKRGARFTEPQIRRIVKQGLGDRGLDQVCQDLGISKSTYYRWRVRYGQGPGRAEARPAASQPQS